MTRQGALKVVLVLVGVLFVAAIYPIVLAIAGKLRPGEENALPMVLSLYVALGVFLLIAARNPSAHRSVIAFAAWSSFAHAAVMSVMAIKMPDDRTDLLIASGALVLLGATLLALSPGRLSAPSPAGT
ncbi:MAG TPA: DUF6632 domain-containing protein [Gemmatimonadales bacterium]|nr:DUF6632 domain-containing protein [Gemmatimonadales bacterium]